MNPKFKIGDRLIYLAAHTGYRPKFIMESILHDGKGYWYREGVKGSWMIEENLELYTEPKPKIKKYLYAYRFGNHPISVSGYFYENDFELKNDPHGQITWCQRLDWSMIEVDV